MSDANLHSLFRQARSTAFAIHFDSSKSLKARKSAVLHDLRTHSDTNSTWENFDLLRSRHYLGLQGNVHRRADMPPNGGPLLVGGSYTAGKRRIPPITPNDRPPAGGVSHPSSPVFPALAVVLSIIDQPSNVVLVVAIDVAAIATVKCPRLVSRVAQCAVDWKAIKRPPHQPVFGRDTAPSPRVGERFRPVVVEAVAHWRGSRLPIEQTNHPMPAQVPHPRNRDQVDPFGCDGVRSRHGQLSGCVRNGRRQWEGKLHLKRADAEILDPRWGNHVVKAMRRDGVGQDLPSVGGRIRCDLHAGFKRH
eukprot:m.357164 g.357164  ORF g.357164 m.357164 type:complete len:305 (-) comp16612_c0_seq3:2069-2983(-)